MNNLTPADAPQINQDVAALTPAQLQTHDGIYIDDHSMLALIKDILGNPNLEITLGASISSSPAEDTTQETVDWILPSARSVKVKTTFHHERGSGGSREILVFLCSSDRPLLESRFFHSWVTTSDDTTDYKKDPGSAHVRLIDESDQLARRIFDKIPELQEMKTSPNTMCGVTYDRKTGTPALFVSPAAREAREELFARKKGGRAD